MKVMDLVISRIEEGRAIKESEIISAGSTIEGVLSAFKGIKHIRVAQTEISGRKYVTGKIIINAEPISAEIVNLNTYANNRYLAENMKKHEGDK